jgi:predicted Zn-dependent protease
MPNLRRRCISWYQAGVLALLLGATVLLLHACQTAPVTGRQQLILISQAEENQMGATAYQQVLSEEKVSTNPQINAMVKRVGQRIAAAAKQPDFQWEFRVIDKDEANAFALPGGKVAVYTGILPYTRTDAGLAVVMGHEVAHVLAHHGAERVSQNLLTQVGLAALQAGLSNKDPLIMQGITLAYGIGVQLPFSRNQESEADRIGLLLMAQAGYDPREAIAFWQRMQADNNQSAPGFLSTHPSGDTRMEQLQTWMPEALTYYKGGR